MKSAKTVFLAAVLSMASMSLGAQIAPVCDSGGVCGTDPNQTTDPSYAGLLASRPMKQNARGSQNPMMVLPGSPGLVPRLPGSQSYNKAIPILHLPGRGIDVDLTLYYNSRIWTVDTANATISFNPDRDFPSYGFRLDFGFMEYDQRNAQFVLTESDGTKHSMPLTANTNGAIFDSNDGTFIEFNNQSLILTYKNGKTVKYQAFPSQATLFRPIQIKDRNGNFISIAYVSGTGNDQHIDTVTDTLNRVIKFVYDPSNHLSQITQAVSSSTDPSGTHVWATFAWSSSPPALPVTLTYSFSGLSVISAPASGSQIPVLISCTYPNQTGYKFSYGAWGIVNRIDQFSSAGQTRSYESYNFPDTSLPLSDAPRYTTMTVSPDGTSTSIWQYSTSQSGPGQVTSDTVTDLFTTSNIINLNADGTPASAQVKDSSGKILRSFIYAWKTVGKSQMISSITSADDAGNQATLSYQYDAFGNVTDLAESDFGNSIVRHTITAYKGDPYSTNHILDLPQSVQITDGQNVVHSRTMYNYDEGTRSPLTVPQNDPNIATPRGNQTSITRYTDAATPGGGITRNFTYDSAGNTITAEVDCCNKKRFTYDPLTQYAYLSSEVRGPDNAQQFTIRYVFNPDTGLAVSTTDENNQTTSYERDGSYRLKITHFPPSNGTAVSQTITYGDDVVNPTITTSTTANSAVTIETYDGLGHVTRKDIQDSSTGSLISTTQVQYDSIWRPSATSNPYAPGEALVWTHFTYDALNRTTLISPPSGGSTRFDFVGNTITTTDAASKQKRNFFDSLGRLVRVDEPGWGDALTAIDSISISGSERSMIVHTRVCVQWGIGGRCLQWELDLSTIYDQGNVTATINGVGYTSPYGSSDNSGTVASSLAAKINSDPNRIVNASPSGSTINLYAIAPGVSGNSISVSVSSVTTDPADFLTGTTSFPASTFTPTLAGGENAVSQDNAVLTATRHLTTTYTYDVNDRIRAASQGAMGPINGQQLPGQPRSYAYDDIGRLISVTTPEAGTETHYYTKSDGTICSTDPTAVCRIADGRGVVKTLSYVDSASVADPLNRLRGVSYSDGTPGSTYTYDVGGQTAFALGRVTTVTDNGNSKGFTYDNIGRVAQSTYSIDGTPYTLQYAYNPANQLTAITYPSNRVINQTYDPLGRLRQIADSTTPATPYLAIDGADYSGAGKVKKITFGNNVQGLFSYNDHLQLATLRYFNPTAPSGTPDLLGLAYDYGNNNNQIQTIHSYSVPNVEDTTQSESFTYDAWGRLTAAQTLRADSTAGTWSLQWTYDRFGNRLSQKLVGGNMPNGVNQPLLVVDPNTNQITNNGFLFDLAGNMTHDGTTGYVFDGGSRLTGISGASSAYTYFGALRIKKVAGGNATVYVYSGSKPIAEYLNGSLSREHVYAGSQLLVTIAGTNKTYHHPDHLSNRAETDASGNLVRSAGYLPFGDVWYETATDPLKFTTYTRDTATGETGLDYGIFRYYNSGLGRFMSADLLPGDTQRPQSLNPYSYTENNPPNAVDPFGLSSWDVTTTNGNCIVTSTYNSVEVKDKNGNWTNHTVLIGTQTTCAGGLGGSPNPPGGPDPGKGPKEPKPKKDPKKEDSEACAKARENLRNLQEESHNHIKAHMETMRSDVTLGVAIGCAAEGPGGAAAGAAAGGVSGGVAGGVVGGIVGGVGGCIEGGAEGGAIALLVWAGSGLWSAYKTDRAIDKAQQEVDAKCN
jgi:RHS repeat-associated protein